MECVQRVQQHDGNGRAGRAILRPVRIDSWRQRRDSLRERCRPGRRQTGNFLWLSVFLYNEVVGMESGYGLTLLVGHNHVDQNHVKLITRMVGAGTGAVAE